MAAGAGLCQVKAESFIPYPTWKAETQVLGTSAALPAAFAGSWIRSEVATT